ncbi:MAG: hypothetical protein ACRCXT_22335 [Paraclostridium sp.]
MIDNIKIEFKVKDLLINKKNKKVILYNKEKLRHVKLSEEVYGVASVKCGFTTLRRFYQVFPMC